jgi:hypothetical protein
MPLLIVLLGILTALAGFAALAFGIQNWAFGIGNTLIAAGSTAAVGGLLLVGLGLVLRSLRALAERIGMLTPGIAGEFQVPLVPQELPLEVEMPVSLPILHDEDGVKPAREIAYRRDEQFKRVREVASRIAEPKSVRIERPQPAAAVDEPADAPVPSSREQTREQRRTWPPRTAMRLEEAAEKKKSWPADRPRAAPPRTPMPPPQAFTPAPAPAPEPEPEPESEQEFEPTPAPVAPVAVTVMRSGIISGMAYTLYTDGSIEAELPLGTVRFGSVEELRAHVARTGADADAEFSGRAPAS